ncbi:peptide chain release factor N(5)-glutamine methyltransferase [Mucilaginibacter sabulilitoris]|uniref:Release factor glutamine methyltransferase n=1 Tax=Mucilaginibacter sabulilitoris TaxID=1173583 RepID=A0ABZ0TIE4_9SPHI|nr:peptide chain release factor N(5)-glutamine methyltransferase [Mucilaginibacter sabulilitoris]WPU91943.1 peptide chain release factor N(5)-glutamine methyltransferase [Mucilaginibacter sabulilitoris]
MITIKDVFEDYKLLNKVYEANEVEAITLLAISEISNLSKAYIKAFPEKELNNDQALKLKDTLNRLQTGEPIQYILGRTEFYGLPFLVNSSVLIPRPETEELVEWILYSLGERQKEDERQKAKGERFGKQAENNILDIGTGSGCIAISLKKNLPGARVSAIDISESALQTAKANAELNEVDVNFINVDILDPQLKTQNSKLSIYNIIVSNPPYVTLDDKKQMHSNVTDFEPHTALFVPEHDPLVFYKAITDFALLNLVPGGLLFFEINENFGNETMEMLNTRGFRDVMVRKDMSGRDRMIKAQRP